MPAAGRGERLGGVLPKAFVPLCGRPLLGHAVDGLLASGRIRSVVVAVPAGFVEMARDALAAHAARVMIVPGGSSRTESVRTALGTIDVEADAVLVHDAARCLTPAPVIHAVLDALAAGAAAVVPVLPVIDTLKRVAPAGHVLSTVDRGPLRAVQTPQGFTVAVLLAAYAAADGAATDDAGLVERSGVAVHTVPGHPLAFKITTPADLELAELLLAAR